MAIALVAAGTAYTATGSGTTFTLNKPAGVLTGHTLIATIAFAAGGSQRTTPAPTGWTIVQTAYKDNGGSDQHQLVVYKRVASSADPATWTVTASASVTFRTATVVAYSGVQAVGASGTSTAGTTTSFSTASVSNTVANAWRVVCGSYLSGTASYTISSNESVRRILATAENSGAVQAAVWDSNATSVPIASTSRTVSRSANWACAASVILLLQPSIGTPASGQVGITLSPAAFTAAGAVKNNATMPIALKPIVFNWVGAGQPVVGTGTMTFQLPAAGIDVSGATVATGTMNTLLPIGIDMVGETRAFGIRVITVEFDKSRLIQVPARAEED